MSIAISVKVLPATNTKPIRYKASANGKSKVYSSPMADVCPFTHAAKQFAIFSNFLNCGQWIGGSVDNMTVVFVSQPQPYNEQHFKIELV